MPNVGRMRSQNSPELLTVGKVSPQPGDHSLNFQQEMDQDGEVYVEVKGKSHTRRLTD